MLREPLKIAKKNPVIPRSPLWGSVALEQSANPRIFRNFLPRRENFEGGESIQTEKFLIAQESVQISDHLQKRLPNVILSVLPLCGRKSKNLFKQISPLHSPCKAGLFSVEMTFSTTGGFSNHSFSQISDLRFQIRRPVLLALTVRPSDPQSNAHNPQVEVHSKMSLDGFFAYKFFDI